MKKKGFWAIVASFLCLSRAALGCDLALVIALDVSRSVDRDEYVLMRDGIAGAFLDDEVLDLIGWMPGGLMVTVTQWGGTRQQRQAINWRRLNSKSSVLDFVSELARIDRGYWMADTSVSRALMHANAMFGPQVAQCRRRVIDVSGDGVSNAGPPVLPIAIAIGNTGVTINGLVVTGAKPDPVAYFAQNVINGPLPFVETANSYADYPAAMTRKLLRELTPALASAPHLTRNNKTFASSQSP